MNDDDWRDEFSGLYGMRRVEYATSDVRYTVQPAPEHLVSRLHLVAVTAPGHVVVSCSDRGWRFLPGGTREPGETLRELARRELIEEAGARLVADVQPFSCFVVDNTGDAPYRPHLPFPRAYWQFGVARVVLEGEPTSPPDGEQITEVVELPPLAAVDFLRVHDSMHADVLRHAIALDLVHAWA